MRQEQGKAEVRPAFRLLAGIVAGAFILGAILMLSDAFSGGTHSDKWRWFSEGLLNLFWGFIFARLAHTGRWMWSRKS
jgi:hypothetical protein